jgi:hypothetical protein
VERLSFTHIAQLLDIDDDTKRLFYEVECVKGNWSVRELKRQIGSLYYERSGLSRDKEKLSVLANQGVERYEPKLTIRDPYCFEWLGIEPPEIMGETHLETLLIRATQYLCQLVQEKHDERRGQSSGRDFTVHGEESDAGGVRLGGDGQQSVCFKIPA